MTKPVPNLVRDFIYLDSFRVRSLASQIGEGLAESRKVERAGVYDTKQHSPVQDSAATTELRLTEERLLLDHVYNELELRISPSALSHDERIDLEQRPILKARGTVEIEDYRELALFIERYNDLGKMIAFATFKDRGNLTSNKQRENALAAHAKAAGLIQDPMQLIQLAEFARTFNRDSFNILFDCSKESGYRVRAVIDRQWLRYSVDFLRGLYATASVVPWIVVGIATYAPGHEQPPSPSESDSPEVAFADGTPNMALLYRNMFRSSSFTANTFNRSIGDEIIILPLAVYREFRIG